MGIYIRDFLKNKKKLNMNVNNCYLIIRFKRKNLFLTLLNIDGNVLCKTNIGSSGFKKKVKFTGYAIKKTTKKFIEKIKNSFLNLIYIIYKNSKKNKEKLKDLILLENSIKLKKRIKFRKKIKKNKIKKSNYIQINNISNKINNIKLIRSNFLKQKSLKNFENYRNYYPEIINNIKNSLNIVIQVKSSLKF
jgi:ribosomal protein S11